VLRRAGLSKDGVKRRDDRHRHRGEQRQDVTAGFAAEDPKFMLQGNDFEPAGVQKGGCPRVFVQVLIVDLPRDYRRIS